MEDKQLKRKTGHKAVEKSDENIENRKETIKIFLMERHMTNFGDGHVKHFI